MQTCVLRVLRATAASWWRHRELRRTGEKDLAQQLERFPLAALAVARGTPFIDIRPTSDVIAFANLPRVTRDGSLDPEHSGAGKCVSLTTYIDMVEALGARIANDPRPR